MEEIVLVGIDWGTSSVRAYAFDRRGQVLAQVSDTFEAAMGVQTLLLRLGRVPQADDFGAALGNLLQTLASKLPGFASTFGSDQALLACGMIGSKQGLKDAGYLVCPTNPKALASQLVEARCGTYKLWIVPGLRMPRVGNVLPDFMRGEETQVLGAKADGLFVLPGSHSKWVDVVGATVTKFETHFSGELFAVLKTHSILGRLFEIPSIASESAAVNPSWKSGAQKIEPSPAEREAFELGLRLAQQHSDRLLQHLFSTRALGLDGQLSPITGESFLSGLLIGHEITAALASRKGVGSIKLVGSPELCERYARALKLFHIPCESLENTAAQGLWQLGHAAHLIESH